MPQKLLSISGWGLIRKIQQNTQQQTDAYDESGGETTIATSWEPRWLSLESGSLLWYLDETQVRPEGMAALLECCVQTGRTLENGERILAIDAQTLDGHIVIEIGIVDTETIFWQEVIDLHVNTLHSTGAVGSAHDFTLEDLVVEEEGASALASMKIHLKGQPHTIFVSPEDDVTLVAEKFVEEHHLKPEIRSKIEMELLRTQVDACLIRESKLKKQVSQVRRRLGDIVLAQGQAAMSEKRAALLSQSLERIEMLLPQALRALEETKARVTEGESAIAHLTMQLNEERGNVILTAKDNDDLHETLQISIATAQTLRSERDDLTSRLRKSQEDLSAAVRNLSEKRFIDDQDFNDEDKRSSATDSSQRDSHNDDTNSNIATRRHNHAQPHAANNNFAGNTIQGQSQRSLNTAAIMNELRDLRKTKATLMKQLTTAQEEVRRANQETMIAYGKKANFRKVNASSSSGGASSSDEPAMSLYGGGAGSSGETESEADSLRVWGHKLEEKIKTLRANLSATEEAKVGCFFLFL